MSPCYWSWLACLSPYFHVCLFVEARLNLLSPSPFTSQVFMSALFNGDMEFKADCWSLVIVRGLQCNAIFNCKGMRN